MGVSFFSKVSNIVELDFKSRCVRVWMDFPGGIYYFLEIIKTKSAFCCNILKTRAKLLWGSDTPRKIRVCLPLLTKKILVYYIDTRILYKLNLINYKSVEIWVLRSMTSSLLVPSTTTATKLIIKAWKSRYFWLKYLKSLVGVNL